MVTHFFVTNPSSIQVGVAQGAVWIKVEGKGSFQNSTSLKEFSKEMVARGHRHFVIDLNACPVMDSTFMGTLAGLALKIRTEGTGEIQVINLNERNHSLLCNLGLDQLLKVENSQGSAVETQVQTHALTAAATDKLTEATTMLEAHEAVVAVAPENVTKFKDVLEFLRQDIQARQ
ncbi:MAG: Anti-anti-sigma regulatory factor (antagonist of anti-sigma factor) [Verrucomicrobia bacterium]|nr:MAG: Anti-anti-sigma regulatory factor (antagonist of anti-sigma factor) [Verrucomicrobiota bacterium]